MLGLVIGGILVLIISILGIALYFGSFIAILYMLFSAQLVWEWLLWTFFVLATIRFLLQLSALRVRHIRRTMHPPEVFADMLSVAFFGILLYAHPADTQLRVIVAIFVVSWTLLKYGFPQYSPL